MRLRMTAWIKHLQNEIVASLEELEASSSPSPLSDTKKPHQLEFKRDHWIRPEGGEGSSCILSNGRVLEKGGVNISIVHGMLPPGAIKQMRADHADMPEPTESLPFFAAGISLVLHPWNPHAPTVHLNYRYFEIDDPTSTAENPKPPLTSWFGGGTDLTPSYLYPEDAKHFHTTLQTACNKHHKSYFPTFKAWCDKYFYIPHRKETRGVGGIFFDDLSSSSAIHKDTQPSQEDIFSFIKTISSAFIPAYVPVLAKHKDDKFTDEERRWQLLRRGRYVEFNLVYDRGTKFGLMTPGARIESILMRWVFGASGADDKSSGDGPLGVHVGNGSAGFRYPGGVITRSAENTKGMGISMHASHPPLLRDGTIRYFACFLLQPRYKHATCTSCSIQRTRRCLLDSVDFSHRVRKPSKVGVHLSYKLLALYT